MLDVYELLGKITTKHVENKDRLEIFGLEKLPKDGPYIIASNHIGSLETILIPTIILNNHNKRVYNLVAEKIYRMCGKKLSERLGFIPVLEGDKSRCLDVAVERLKQGNILNIFPEGARSRPKKTKHQLLRGKTGVARLALKAQVPVIPFGSHGPHDNNILMLLKHWYISKQKVKAGFGDLLSFEEHYEIEHTKDILESAVRKIMQEIAKVSGQEYIH